MNRRDFIKNAVGGSLAGAGVLAHVNTVFGASAAEGEMKERSKKSLIIYASRTNNTTKVAERFKSTLERNGWQCDIHKINKSDDAGACPYAIEDYELVCAGSGINLHAPYAELIAALRFPRYGGDPTKVDIAPGERLPTEGATESRVRAPSHNKIVFRPESPKTVSFVTYGGMDFGPWEVQPALDWINVETAHLGIEPVGKFCCPGKFLPHDLPEAYFNDLTTRPNEKDLLRAELFIEEVLEAIAYRPSAAS